MSQKVKEELTKIFGTDFKVISNGHTIKVNIPSIDTIQLQELSALSKNTLVHGVNLKRSGTGITILVGV